MLMKSNKREYITNKKEIPCLDVVQLILWGDVYSSSQEFINTFNEATYSRKEKRLYGRTFMLELSSDGIDFDTGSITLYQKINNVWEACGGTYIDLSHIQAPQIKSHYETA